MIVDKCKGNILKIDRHKYVHKAYHGCDELSTIDRKAEYSHEVHSYTESNFVILDTLFLVVDASLFAHLVDFKDKNPEIISKSYEQIHSDVRKVVDQCHMDGTIKDAVMKDPAKYIIHDDGLVPMMRRYKEAGKKVKFEIVQIFLGGYRSRIICCFLAGVFVDKQHVGIHQCRDELSRACQVRDVIFVCSVPARVLVCVFRHLDAEHYLLHVLFQFCVHQHHPNFIFIFV